MKKMVLLMLMVAVAVSCNKGGKVAETPKGPVLAKVNGGAITLEDAKREFETLPPQVKQFFIEQRGMEDLVEELVKKELLYQEAARKGPGSGAEFQKRMEDFKKRLMIELLLEEEVEKKAKVSEQELKDFYEKNKAEFVMNVPGKGKQTVDFERIKGLIEQRLEAEKQKELFDSYIDSLKKTHKVELDKEAIKKAFANAPDKQ